MALLRNAGDEAGPKRRHGENFPHIITRLCDLRSIRAGKMYPVDGNNRRVDPGTRVLRTTTDPMTSQRSHAKKNAKRRAALKKKQALNLAPATPVVEKKGRRAPVVR
jgi:hypothetical protein